MEIVEKILDIDNAAVRDGLLALPCPAEDVCFFDIETTGLSAQVSSVYLIGVIHIFEGKLKLVQWFADDYVSEKELLLHFTDYISGFQTLIHFNGNTFDVPYLRHKIQQHKIETTFPPHDHMDLYSYARHLRPYIHTANQKLTTMERLFGFVRNDTFSGKDCIQLYLDYMKMKFYKDSGTAAKKNQLLQHNRDDLLGTITCGNYLCYAMPEILSYSEEYTEDAILFSGKTSGTYKIPLQLESPLGFSLCCDDRSCTAKVPLHKETLYHFFPDYKNYYYLPDEDMAIHKSIGTYVDSSHRKKATASNCYVKQQGTFFCIPAAFSPDSHTIFQKGYKEKDRYLLQKEKQPETPLFTKEEGIELLLAIHKEFF